MRISVPATPSEPSEAERDRLIAIIAQVWAKHSATWEMATGSAQAMDESDFNAAAADLVSLISKSINE